LCTGTYDETSGYLLLSILTMCAACMRIVYFIRLLLLLTTRIAWNGGSALGKRLVVRTLPAGLHSSPPGVSLFVSLCALLKTLLKLGSGWSSAHLSILRQSCDANQHVRSLTFLVFAPQAQLTSFFPPSPHHIHTIIVDISVLYNFCFTRYYTVVLYKFHLYYILIHIDSCCLFGSRKSLILTTK
jgi:hypothetical protein